MIEGCNDAWKSITIDVIFLERLEYHHDCFYTDVHITVHSHI